MDATTKAFLDKMRDKIAAEAAKKIDEITNKQLISNMETMIAQKIIDVQTASEYLESCGISHAFSAKRSNSPGSTGSCGSLRKSSCACTSN